MVIDMNYRLENKQILAYHETGFLTINKLFSAQECDDILKIVQQHADPNFSAILNLDRKVPELRKVMKSLKIVSILEALQQAEVVGLQTQAIFKEPRSPYASHAWNPHQDNAYFQSSDDAALNCHIILEDHDINNGCLYGFSGSHKEGIFPFTHTISYKAKANTNPGSSVSDEVIKKYSRNKVDFILKKGDVVFMHANTIHGSYPNLSDRSRPILTMCYISKGEYFVPGKNAKRMEIPLH